MGKPEMDSLLFGAVHGDEAALAQLVSQFMPYISRRASAVAKHSAAADVEQEGLISLFRAVKSYNPAAGASFETYAYKCIDNAVLSYIKSTKRKKNELISSSAELSENIPQREQQGPMLAAELTESIDDIGRAIETKLSKFEKRVLYMYLQGFSYDEISAKLGRAPKAIDNALQRLRRKLKQQQ